MNAIARKSPATLHSGVGCNALTIPQQVMSPNMEESPTAESAQPSGSANLDTTRVKDEPHTRSEQVKEEEVLPDIKIPTLDVKEEGEQC